MGIMGTKVVLKTPEGKTLKVPASGLSEADKKYLASNIPPKLKIEVDVDKDRETLASYSSTYGTYGYERKAETIKCTVTVSKTNRDACDKSFKAIIYVFGESIESKRIRVLDVSEQAVSFKNSKSTSFSSDPATVEFSDSSYRGKDGCRYAGYLVIVIDEQEQVVKFESSKTAYENHIAQIREAKENNSLDKDFCVISVHNNRVHHY